MDIDEFIELAVLKNVMAESYSVTKKTFIVSQTDSLTPLQVAAMIDGVDMCQHLVEEGADFIVKCKKLGASLMHYAAMNDQYGLDLLDYFSSLGLKLDAKDKFGDEPLQYAIKMNNSKVIEKLLQKKCPEEENNKDQSDNESRYHSILANMVLEQDKGLLTDDMIETGSSAIHLAAMLSDLDMCKWLLNKGVDVRSLTKNESEYSVLHCAAFNKSHGKELVQFFILEHSFDVNAKDKLGFTPLHCALYKENIETAEELLKRGANLALRRDTNGLENLENLMHFCDRLVACKRNFDFDVTRMDNQIDLVELTKRRLIRLHGVKRLDKNAMEEAIRGINPKGTMGPTNHLTAYLPPGLCDKIFQYLLVKMEQIPENNQREYLDKIDFLLTENTQTLNLGYVFPKRKSFSASNNPIDDDELQLVQWVVDKVLLQAPSIVYIVFNNFDANKIDHYIFIGDLNNFQQLKILEMIRVDLDLPRVLQLCQELPQLQILDIHKIYEDISYGFTPVSDLSIHRTYPDVTYLEINFRIIKTIPSTTLKLPEFTKIKTLIARNCTDGTIITAMLRKYGAGLRSLCLESSGDQQSFDVKILELCPRLEAIQLESIPFTDTSTQLENLPRLKELYLIRTSDTSRSLLPIINSSPNLQKLEIYGRFDKKGLNELNTKVKSESQIFQELESIKITTLSFEPNAFGELLDFIENVSAFLPKLKEIQFFAGYEEMENKRNLVELSKKRLIKLHGVQKLGKNAMETIIRSIDPKATLDSTNHLATYLPSRVCDEIFQHLLVEMKQIPEINQRECLEKIDFLLTEKTMSLDLSDVLPKRMSNTVKNYVAIDDDELELVQSVIDKVKNQAPSIVVVMSTFRPVKHEDFLVKDIGTPPQRKYFSCGNDWFDSPDMVIHLKHPDVTYLEINFQYAKEIPSSTLKLPEFSKIKTLIARNCTDGTIITDILRIYGHGLRSLLLQTGDNSTG
ncbi:Hypothetical predicted protein [Cloeon dipterum]|uniref:Uncharacterized protein n=1 Tax=Cloeon dipterum TaxID=197152 RepID=A0A8S1DCC6_9INSE|nr:Hypothetical predicted protein [Cloeon dipterum]